MHGGNVSDVNHVHVKDSLSCFDLAREMLSDLGHLADILPSLL